MNLDDPGAGLAGIELVLPALLAAPPAAEHALLESRYGVRCAAQVADVLRETSGIFLGRLPLLSHDRNLVPEIPEEIA